MAKGTNRLTPAAIQGAKVDKILTDGNGLTLLREKDGKRRAIWRHHGRDLPLDVYVVLGTKRPQNKRADQELIRDTLDEARRRAAERVAELGQGLDPWRLREERLLAIAMAEGDGMPWNTRKAMEENARITGAEWQAHFRKDYFARFDRHIRPVLKDTIPLADVTVADAVRALENVTSKRLRQVIARDLYHATALAIAKKQRPVDRGNPFDPATLKLELGKYRHREQHFAAIEYMRLPSVMPKLSAGGVHAKAAAVTIYLACRPSEIGDMLHGEVDLEQAVFHLPGARTKTGEPRDIPLAPPVLEILRSVMREKARPSDPVFVGQRGMITADSMRRALVEVSGIEATLHGTSRSGFRDFGAENGIPAEVAERVLGHKPQGVVGAYQRSDLPQQRRAALTRWAEFLCTGQRPAAEVVTLPTRAITA